MNATPKPYRKKSTDKRANDERQSLLLVYNLLNKRVMHKRMNRKKLYAVCVPILLTVALLLLALPLNAVAYPTTVNPVGRSHLCKRALGLDLEAADWQKYLAEVTQKGESLEFLRDELFPVLRTLPQETKLALLEQIKDLRPLSTKERRSELSQNLWLPSRKVLDFLLQSLVPARTLIENALNNGESFNAALNRYYKTVRGVVNPGGPAYAADKTVAVAEALQKWLREIPTSEGAFKKAVIFGSFAKGTANLLTSDLDLFVRQSELLKVMHLELEPFNQQITEVVNRPLQSLSVGGELKYNLSGGSNFYWMRVPSPLFIVVTPRAIHFFIFDSMSRLVAETTALHIEIVNGQAQTRGVISAEEMFKVL